MSGAASNSAARRRRGGTPAPFQGQAQNNPHELSSELKPPISPWDLIRVHDRKIYSIEQYLELTTKSLDSNAKGDPVAPNTSLSASELTDIKQRIVLLEEINKNKELEKEVSELKESLAKLQSFTTEINQALLDFKEVSELRHEAVIKDKVSDKNDISVGCDVDVEAKDAKLASEEEVAKEIEAKTKDKTKKKKADTNENKNESATENINITFGKVEKLDL